MTSHALAPKIEIKNLENNPGILPLKLGPTRVQYTHHTFLHNYPLRKIGIKINQLESSLNAFQDKTKGKLAMNMMIECEYVSNRLIKLKGQIRTIHPDILDSRNRQKRGIINALGSVFKFISGNLDASDGARYDKLLTELQTNQQNLIQHYNQQLSLNKKLTQNFEENLRNISENFKRIDECIRMVRGEDQNLTNTLVMFRIALSDLHQIVSNIHTAISFASLNALHLSIIDEESITLMKNELDKFNDKNSYYSYDNVLFVRTISVDYYITAEHIVFLLHVPILDPKPYNLYHLYSIPTTQSTTIIPPTSYVAMTEEKIYYLKSKCQQLQNQFFCKISHLERNYQQEECIKNLLQVKKNPPCNNVPVQVSEPLVETISDDRYLLILPEETLVHEKCGTEEVHRLKGVYLVKVPFSCKFITANFEYANLEGELDEEPVYLPPGINSVADVKPLQLNLKSFNLDQLSKLTLEQNELQPVSYMTDETLWTHSNLPIYVIVIVTIIIVLLYKFRNKLFSIF